MINWFREWWRERFRPVPKPKTVIGQARGDFQVTGTAPGRRKPRVPTLSALTGFEYGLGTATAMVAGLNGNRVFDEASLPAGSFKGSGRVDGELVSTVSQWFSYSGNSGYATWRDFTFGTTNTIVATCYIWVNTLTAASPVFYVDTNSPGTFVGRVNLKYNPTGNVLTLEMPGETSQTATATVPLDTWFRLDLRVDYSCTALSNQYIADWQINGALQTRLLSATGKSAATVGYVGVSDPSNKTGYIAFDDFGISTVYDDFPIGELRIYPMLSETAPSAAVFGDPANFKLFRTSPSLYYQPWDQATLTDIFQAIGDRPGNQHSAPKGVVQSRPSATDYCEQYLFSSHEILAADEAVVGGRLIIYGWAENNSGANIEIRLWNGIQEYVIFPLGNPGFDATVNDVPALARMIPLWVIDTQDKINNLTIRFGYSNTTLPIGINSTVIELAIAKPSVTGAQFLQSQQISSTF